MKKWVIFDFDGDEVRDIRACHKSGVGVIWV